MSEKKLYAIITKGATEYCAHIGEYRAKVLKAFHDETTVRYCTKAEYRAARDAGMPRWDG